MELEQLTAKLAKVNDRIAEIWDIASYGVGFNFGESTRARLWREEKKLRPVAADLEERIRVIDDRARGVSSG